MQCAEKIVNSPAAVVGNTVPINLVAPGQVWGDRVNALDLRFAKILRFVASPSLRLPPRP